MKRGKSSHVVVKKQKQMALHHLARESSTIMSQIRKQTEKKGCSRRCKVRPKEMCENVKKLHEDRPDDDEGEGKLRALLEVELADEGGKEAENHKNSRRQTDARGKKKSKRTSRRSHPSENFKKERKKKQQNVSNLKQNSFFLLLSLFLLFVFACNAGDT